MNIPNKIYQFGNTKNQNYKTINFSIEDCQDYLLKNFGQNYLNAFNILTSNTLKCDFWKYAILYNEGGIYINFNKIEKVPDLEPTDRFVSIIDNNNLVDCGISVDFIACEPKHPIMKNALEISFNNISVRRKDFFDNLGITGPIVLCQALNLYYKKLNMYETIQTKNDNGIRLLENKSESSSKLSSFYDFSEPYNDNTIINKYTIYKVVLLSIIVIGLTALIFSLKYRKKWKVCEKSCSISRI